MAPPPLRSLQDRACRYVFRRRLRGGVAACAVVAVVAGGVALWSAEPASGPRPRLAVGVLQALPAPAVAPVPPGTAPAHGAPGTWRLASYLSEPLSWRRNTNSGPAAGGYLSCPQAGTCYYAGAAGGGKPSGPGPSLSTLYVSHDSGLSWTAIRIVGAGFTTALTCPAAGHCMAGGEISGQAVLLTTSDGGYRWDYRALPPGDGSLDELVCPALASCRGLAAPSGRGLAGRQSLALFLRTDNAGADWSRISFPPGDAMSALSCLNAAACVAAGTGDGHVNAAGDSPMVALRTADGGRSWTAAGLPAGLSFPANSPGTVACAGASTCYALALSPQRSAEGYFDWSVVLISTDSGVTWRTLALPPHTPSPGLFNLSCPDARHCWIAGTEAVPQTIPGGGQNGGSAMILATSNGGESWSKATFAAVRLASGQQGDSLMAVGEIACAQGGSCVGLGVADQGSYHTPVYTNAGG